MVCETGSPRLLIRCNISYMLVLIHATEICFIMPLVYVDRALLDWRRLMVCEDDVKGRMMEGMVKKSKWNTQAARVLQGDRSRLSF